MARIRTVKPGFFTDADLCALDPLCRLAFEGLWCHADREGRLRDNPDELRVQILPYDKCDFDKLLSELTQPKNSNPNLSFIVRYQINGEKFIQINQFLDHQCPNQNEPKSIIPKPSKNGSEIIAGLYQDSLYRKGREGKGKERKGIKEGEYLSAFFSQEFQESEKFKTVWSEWITYRRKEKTPVSEAAARKQAAKLGAVDIDTACKMIDRSIENDWTGIFPLNENGKKFI